MKMLVLIGCLFSLNAFACPDISGKYKNADGSVLQEILLKKDANGVFNLVAGDVPTIIDGASHELQPGVNYTATCNANNIIIKIKQGNSELGSLTYTQLSNNRLQIVSTGMENSVEELIKY